DPQLAQVRQFQAKQGKEIDAPRIEMQTLQAWHPLDQLGGDSPEAVAAEIAVVVLLRQGAEAETAQISQVGRAPQWIQADELALRRAPLGDVVARLEVLIVVGVDVVDPQLAQQHRLRRLRDGARKRNWESAYAQAVEPAASPVEVAV